MWDWFLAKVEPGTVTNGPGLNKIHKSIETHRGRPPSRKTSLEGDLPRGSALVQDFVFESTGHAMALGVLRIILLGVKIHN